MPPITDAGRTFGRARSASGPGAAQPARNGRQAPWRSARGSADAETYRLQQTGRVPARKSLRDQYVKFLDPSKPPENSHYYIDVIAGALPLPATPNWDQVRSIISKDLDPMYKGTKAAKDACAAIVQQVNPLLAQYKQ